MNPLHSILLNTYYYGDLPRRRRQAVARAARGQTPVMVLFYHRVADESPNDWTISRRQFAKQVDWLRRRFDLISLEELQRRVGSGRNDRPAVAITFDDGYADNCEFALPLLVRHAIPVTYFVSTDHIVRGRPFPHDVAAGRPLRPNSLRQLREMSTQGIEIGAHTRSHADIGQIVDRDTLVDEMVTARDELARAIDRPIRYFAFPFGHPQNMSAEAFRLAAASGYAGVCSAYGGYNFPGDDAFHIERIHGDPEMARLKNWMSVDPRKLKRELETAHAGA